MNQSNFIYTYNDKKDLLRRITNIKYKVCYKQIFKLLIKYNINYTRNNNGIFFNLASLEDDTLNKINDILVYHEFKKNKIINNNIY